MKTMYYLKQRSFKVTEFRDIRGKRRSMTGTLQRDEKLKIRPLVSGTKLPGTEFNGSRMLTAGNE